MDTHLHTCLSPCAELEMHPAALCDAAARAGLDLVAVCDHNSAENVAATMRAGERAGVAVVAGMELCTAEEVHLLALLPDAEAALNLQARVYDALPGRNDEAVFGQQVVVDEGQEVLGFCDRLLIGATTIDLATTVDEVHRLGGLAVAAHIDREAFGLIGQLGMIPHGLPLDALEVSRHASLPQARTGFAVDSSLPLLCASDAHRPEAVGEAVSYMLLAAPTFEEVGRALRAVDGRAVLGGGRPMEDLALHVLDVAQNSVEAGARRIEIDIHEDRGQDLLAIEIRDDGRGMAGEVLARVSDPFFTTRTTRKVGMGLSLLRAAAEAAGGGLTVDSTPGQGTRVRATFSHRHVDRAPLGDLETTLLVLVCGHAEVDVVFRHTVEGEVFVLDTLDVRAALEGSALSSPEGLMVLREAIRRGEADLRSSADSALEGTRHPGGRDESVTDELAARDS